MSVCPLVSWWGRVLVRMREDNFCETCCFEGVKGEHNGPSLIAVPNIFLLVAGNKMGGSDKNFVQLEF